MSEFPAAADVEEALRAAHNFQAFYEGLGVIKRMLQVYHLAAEQYEAVQQVIDQAAKALAEKQAALADADQRLQALDADYTQRHADLDAQHQEWLTHLATERETAEQELVRAQQDVLASRRTIAQEQASAQGRLQADLVALRKQGMAEVEAVKQEHTRLTEEVRELTAQRERLEQAFADAARSVRMG